MFIFHQIKQLHYGTMAHVGFMEIMTIIPKNDSIMELWRRLDMVILHQYVFNLFPMIDGLTLKRANRSVSMSDVENQVCLNMIKVNFKSRSLESLENGLQMRTNHWTPKGKIL